MSEPRRDINKLLVQATITYEEHLLVNQKY